MERRAPRLFRPPRSPPRLFGPCRSAWHQALVQHAAQRRGEAGAHGGAAFGLPQADQAGDRRRRAGSGHAGEHEPPGLGGGQRELAGFAIRDLADQQHVDVLARRRAQAGGDRRDVQSDLALNHHAAPILEHDLDRILDGHDAQPDAASSDRRPARRAWSSCPPPGPAATSTKPAPGRDQIARAGRQAQAVQRRRLGRDEM